MTLRPMAIEAEVVELEDLPRARAVPPRWAVARIHEAVGHNLLAQRHGQPDRLRVVARESGQVKPRRGPPRLAEVRERPALPAERGWALDPVAGLARHRVVLDLQLHTIGLTQ